MENLTKNSDFTKDSIEVILNSRASVLLTPISLPFRGYAHFKYIQQIPIHPLTS